RLRAPQGDPRDRRARHIRQRAPRIAARHGRRGRLHQDLHREDPQRCDASGGALHARGDSRRARGDGPCRRLQARRRRPRREAGDPASRARARDARARRAVAAAREAFANGWSALPGSERAKYLFRIARILQERSREFAVLESLNGGKPIKESRDVDLPLAAAHFFYYAGWSDKLEYAFPNRRPKPVGVAGQIIPWNFPLLMLAWKIAPAIACGNTVVLKPAETTPLSALLFCDVLRQA